MSRSLRCASETGVEARHQPARPRASRGRPAAGTGHAATKPEAAGRERARGLDQCRARPVAGREESRASGRRERHGRDEPRVIAKAGALVGLRPREVEDELAPGMRLQVERERAARVRHPARARRTWRASQPVSAVAQPVVSSACRNSWRRNGASAPGSAFHSAAFDLGERADDARFHGALRRRRGARGSGRRRAPPCTRCRPR